jgi:hypothetical protein
MKVRIKLTQHGGVMPEINCTSVKVLDCETFISIVCDAGEPTETATTIGKNFKPVIEVIYED